MTAPNLDFLAVEIPVQYDAAFQMAIGGYPIGALVESTSTPGTYWKSTVDDNMTDPDASGAGWQSVSPAFAES